MLSLKSLGKHHIGHWKQENDWQCNATENLKEKTSRLIIC